MEDIKYRILNNWSLARWIRLVLGIVVGVQAWQAWSGLLALLAVILLYQAVMNAGCCGAGGCSVPPPAGKKSRE